MGFRGSLVRIQSSRPISLGPFRRHRCTAEVPIRILATFPFVPNVRRGAPMPDRMPVYRLSSDEPSVSRLTELGRGLFNVNDHFQLGTNGRTRQLRNGHHVVEIAGESAGVWAADESQLWNPTLRPQLVPEKQAVAQAEKTLRELSLLP